MTENQIIENIKTHLKEIKRNPKWLASEINMSYQGLRLTFSQKTLKLSTYLEICNVLNVPADYFMSIQSNEVMETSQGYGASMNYDSEIKKINKEISSLQKEIRTLKDQIKNT